MIISLTYKGNNELLQKKQGVVWTPSNKGSVIAASTLLFVPLLSLCARAQQVTSATSTTPVFARCLPRTDAVSKPDPTTISEPNAEKPKTADLKIEATYGIEWASRRPYSAVKVDLSAVRDPNGDYIFYEYPILGLASPTVAETPESQQGIAPFPVSGKTGKQGNRTITWSNTQKAAAKLFRLYYVPPSTPEKTDALIWPRTSPMYDPLKEGAKGFSTASEAIPIDVIFVERDPIQEGVVYLFYKRSYQLKGQAKSMSAKGKLYVGVLGEPTQTAKNKEAEKIANRTNAIELLNETVAAARSQTMSNGVTKVLNEAIGKAKDRLKDNDVLKETLTQAFRDASAATSSSDAVDAALKVLVPAQLRLSAEAADAKPLPTTVLLTHKDGIAPTDTPLTTSDSGLGLNSTKSEILPPGGSILAVNPAGTQSGPFLMPTDGVPQRLFTNSPSSTKEDVTQLKWSNLRFNRSSLLPINSLQRSGRSDLIVDLLLSSENRDANSKIALTYLPFQRNASDLFQRRSRLYTVVQRDQGLIWSPQLKILTSQRYFAERESDKDRSYQWIVSPYDFQLQATVGNLLASLNPFRKSETPRPGLGTLNVYGAPQAADPKEFPGLLEWTVSPLQYRWESIQFRATDAVAERTETSQIPSLRTEYLYLPSFNTAVKWQTPIKGRLGSLQFPSSLSVQYRYTRFMTNRNDVFRRGLERAGVEIPIDLKQFSQEASLLEVAFQLPSGLGIKQLQDKDIRVGYRAGYNPSSGYLNPAAKDVYQFFIELAL